MAVAFETPTFAVYFGFGLVCSSFTGHSCFSSRASMTPTTGYNNVLTLVFCLIWLWVGFVPRDMDHITHCQWELCKTWVFSSCTWQLIKDIWTRFFQWLWSEFVIIYVYNSNALIKLRLHYSIFHGLAVSLAWLLFTQCVTKLLLHLKLQVLFPAWLLSARLQFHWTFEFILSSWPHWLCLGIFVLPLYS